jgi:hypothetical protein
VVGVVGVKVVRAGEVLIPCASFRVGDAVVGCPGLVEPFAVAGEPPRWVSGAMPGPALP